MNLTQKGVDVVCGEAADTTGVEPAAPKADTTTRSARANREQTLSGILAAINDPDISSSRSTTVISGPAGIGKSWLMERVLASLLRSPHQRLVLRATGHWSETEFQFAGLGQLLRPVLAEAKNLPPAERVALRSAIFGAAFTAEAVENLHRIAIATLTLLEKLSQSQPTVLLIDNAQWLDSPTGRTLTFLSHRLRASHIKMILATRDATAAGLLESEHIALDYMDDFEARTLVQEIAPGLPAAVVQRVVASAGGMPLALVEISRLPDLQRRLEVNKNFLPGDVLDALPPGDTMLTNYRERISWMSTTELRALITVALDSLTLEQLKTVYEQIGAEFTDLAAAEHANLVEWVDGLPRIAHPTVLGALRELVPGSEQIVVRQAISTVLQNDPARAAKHLIVLQENTVPKVADTLEEAASSASEFGEHLEAGRLWELASDRTASDDYETKTRRLLAAARANIIAGNRSAALRCTRRLYMLARGHGDVAIELEAQRNWLLINHGTGLPLTLMQTEGPDQDAVNPLTARAIAAASTAPQQAANLLTTLMNVLIVRGRHEDAQRVARVFQEHVPAGVRGIEAELLIESIERADRSLRPDDLLFTAWAEILNDEALLRFFETADALVPIMIWSDAPATHELLARFQGLVERRNLLSMAPRIAFWRATSAQRFGHWQDALRKFGEAEQALLTTDFRGHELEILLFQAWLTALMGDEFATKALIARARKTTTVRPPTFTAITDAITAMLHYSHGRCERAIELFAKSAPSLRHFGAAHPIVPAVLVAHIEALWRMRRIEEAEALFERFENQAAAKRSRRHQALVSRCRGLFATDFTPHFARAVEIHKNHPASREADPNLDVDLARTLLMWGMRLRRMRHKNEAAKALHRALAIFTSLGAQPWLEFTRSELKACGERHVTTSDLPPAVQALTPREYEIAVEAARGSTNVTIAAKLGISPRTVEQHLGSAFQKLGIHSRTELHGLIADAG